MAHMLWEAVFAQYFRNELFLNSSPNT